MSYQIVYPYPAAMTIDAESFKDAVKSFAKLNYNLSINSLIIRDQYKYMKADLKYYKKDNRKTVGISLMPTVWPVGKDGKIGLDMWPLAPSISYDTKEYPATQYLEFEPKIVPFVPVVGLDAAPLLPPLFSF